jgi:hypothetical protein
MAMHQVDVLEYYDTTVRSASAQFYIPAVLRVRMYVSKREFKAGRMALSRRNIVMRDKGMCQYALLPLLSWPPWILHCPAYLPAQISCCMYLLHDVPPIARLSEVFLCGSLNAGTVDLSKT